MAKEQGLSLNPTKISGSCGRLMCCLKYEEDAYSHLASITPRVGSTVKTPQGIGTVTDVNLVTGNLYVKLLDSDALPFKIHRDNVSRASNPRKANKSQNNE
jgi:cell fate regulator YaaT (PSP1 superfamily)